MPLTLVTPSDEEPVSLDEMKQHLKREDVSDDDEYIDSLIRAARELIEQSTGCAFVDQTWRLTLRDWPCSGFVRLPRNPLLEVVSVTYRDTAGAYQTLQENVGYFVDAASEPGTIDAGNGCWPITGCYADAIVVVFRAGYLDLESSRSGDIPDRAKLAIKHLAAWWYGQREPVGAAVMALPLHLERLIRSLRVFGDG
jgi:uncharacterized phiE125 gp8 family phage protein